jgi:hypothetical protein
MQGGAISNEGSVMLNLYAVKVWHPSAPGYGETINIRTYTIDRAEHLAAESYPGCVATAQPLLALVELSPRPEACFGRSARAH